MNALYNKQHGDADLALKIALPAAASTTVTSDELTWGDGADIGDVEAVVTVEALTATMLPAAATQTISVIQGTTTIGTVTLTGTASTGGHAGGEVARYRLTPGLGGTVYITIVSSATAADSSTKKATFGLYV